MLRFVLQPNKLMIFNDTITRWIIPNTINYNSKANLVCDRANEDHCGTCGNGLLTNNADINYHIMQRNKIDTIFLDKMFNEAERYYYPFIL